MDSTDIHSKSNLHRKFNLSPSNDKSFLTRSLVKNNCFWETKKCLISYSPPFTYVLSHNGPETTQRLYIHPSLFHFRSFFLYYPSLSLTRIPICLAATVHFPRNEIGLRNSHSDDHRHRPFDGLMGDGSFSQVVSSTVSSLFNFLFSE